MHAQGNKWTCPHVDSISVCSNLDEVQLGKLKCVDEAGLADSATSRYSVIDLLRIMPASVDCPEQELVSWEASELFDTRLYTYRWILYTQLQRDTQQHV